MEWPTQKDVLNNISVYGNPMGKDPAKSSVKWEAQNLVYIAPPFIMTYAGKAVSRIRVHRYCAMSLERILRSLFVAAKEKQATLDHWGVSIFGGCMNYRLMRGGDKLSMHSYGCAIDLDPSRNSLSDRTPRFAEFPEVLRAFDDEDWIWGGDWNGNGSSADERRADGMHWQATQ